MRPESKTGDNNLYMQSSPEQGAKMDGERNEE